MCVCMWKHRYAHIYRETHVKELWYQMPIKWNNIVYLINIKMRKMVIFYKVDYLISIISQNICNKSK